MQQDPDGHQLFTRSGGLTRATLAPGEPLTQCVYLLYRVASLQSGWGAQRSTPRSLPRLSGSDTRFSCIQERETGLLELRP